MKYLISPPKSWSLPCYAESFAAMNVEMTSFSTSEEASSSQHVLQFLDVEAVEDNMDSDQSLSSIGMNSSG